jgi:hypothetical protein
MCRAEAWVGVFGRNCTAIALRCDEDQSMKPEGVVAFSSGDERRLLIVDDGGGYAVFDYPESDQ